MSISNKTFENFYLGSLVEENNWTRLGPIDPIDPISKRSLKLIYYSDSKWSHLIESD